MKFARGAGRAASLLVADGGDEDQRHRV